MGTTPDLKTGAVAPSMAPRDGADTAVHGATGLRAYLPALAVLAALFAWLLARSLHLTPTVFADEWYYSRLSRLQPLSEAVLPSYLYLGLFRVTNMCGDGYLDCARGLNALFFVGAAPFVYLTARAFTSRATAAALALLATLAPLDIYTAFFMPESMYYFGFSVLSWVALTRRDWHWATHALACSLVLGLMSLIKVHAVFLVPALCLFLLYARWLAGGAWLRQGLAAMAIGAATVFAVRFGLGYLMAGAPALDLFGPFYGSGATQAGQRSMLRLLLPGSIVLRGHLMVLALLSGLPLAILAQGVLRPSARANATPADLLRIYALLFLGAAAGMTVLFTATLGANDPAEAFRLHLRYYSFVFPMLWLAAAAAPSAAEATGARAAWLRWTLALLLIALLAWAWLRLPTFSINAVDSPEAAALPLNHAAGRIVALLEVAVLLLWASGKLAARKLFLFGVLPLMALAGMVGNHRYLSGHSLPWPGDKAGLFAHRVIPAAERDQVTVMGSGVEQVMRAQFHIGSAHMTSLDVAPDAPVESWHLPLRNKWLLVVGKHRLPAGVKAFAATDDFALLHLPNDNRVLGRARLTEPFGTGLIASAEGLSQQEGFGRWSDAKRIVLHLNMTLPRKLNLIVKGWSYGSNANGLFQVHVGDRVAAFHIGNTEEESGVRMETDGTQRDIVIEVPHPTSPQEGGESNDPRKLGLALVGIEIATPAKP